MRWMPPPSGIEYTKTVLERTDGPNVAALLTSDRTNFSRERKLIELISGEKLEFDAVGTKPEWEEKLITIRIPLRKGIQGYQYF